MELALSLGDSSQSLTVTPPPPASSPRLDFCMALGLRVGEEETTGDGCRGSSLGLDLLPSSSAHRSSRFRLPWLVEHLGSELELLSGRGKQPDVNRFPDVIEDVDDAAAQSSSPNSVASSFPMEFGIAVSGSRSRRMETEIDVERDCSRGSDEDENGSTRKKLRLSKEQSALLEESFKEHSTLNPKQKIALAKQLNLRPRQVEVWFQNRRARTKLKQTEIDCEHLKRCCETLTEENRRLQKELQDLRALKTAPPFYMQPPATTLTMCPSCERSSIPATSPAVHIPIPLPKPRVHPFAGSHPGRGQGHQDQHSSGP